MLRSDVQDKILEALDAILEAVKMMREPMWAAPPITEQNEHFCCGQMRPWSQGVCGLCDTGPMTGPIDPDWNPRYIKTPPPFAVPTDNDLRNKAANEMIDNAAEAMKNVPAPARRMWKLWAMMGAYGRPIHFTQHDLDTFSPFTILPGHDAVERLEREAYQRGWNDREGDLLVAADRIADDKRYAIDGVAPVVVDGITWDEGERKGKASLWPWVYDDDVKDFIVAVFRGAGGKCHTPCRVHLYPGVGSDGKKVQP